MLNGEVEDLRRIRRMRWRYLVVLIVIGVLAAGIHLLVERSTRDLRQLNSALQLIHDGRTQLIQLPIDMEKLAQIPTGDPAGIRLSESIFDGLDYLEDLNSTLAYGYPDKGISDIVPPTVGTLFFGPNAFLERDLRLLAEKTRDWALRWEHAEQAITLPVGEGDVIRLLAQYEQVAEAYKSAVENQQSIFNTVRTVGTTLTIIVLAIAGAFVFEPMVRRMRAYLGERRKYSDKLQDNVSTQTSISLDRQFKILRLNEIGTSLSLERDHTALLRSILLTAMDLSDADGGTVYIRSGDEVLSYGVIVNNTLEMCLDGSAGNEVPFDPIAIFDPDTGKPNDHYVAVQAILSGETIHTIDIDPDDEHFLGVKRFYDQTGYLAERMITTPLRIPHGDTNGVLQLINPVDVNGEGVPFSQENIGYVESLASQAAVALDNFNRREAEKSLLDSLMKLLAAAIDSKSPYTGGHCLRVPELANFLAEAACQSTDTPFEAFSMDEADWYEFKTAALLHDCGKVTTPEYVVDKATKLETIYNRIHEIRMRFEVLRRDAEIKALRKHLADDQLSTTQAEVEDAAHRLEDEFMFVAECNVGSEFVSDDKVERLKKIASRTWSRHFDDRLGLSREEAARQNVDHDQKYPVKEYLLADKAAHVTPRADGHLDGSDSFTMKMPENKFNRGELHNLSISRGTLTEEERYVINDHIIQTIIMLEQLPFPKGLRRVPEFAGGHHERMDGKGYPRGVMAGDMPLQARILAVADVFEALTAGDRPYKTAKTLSESLNIMSFMVKEGHLDPDLFNLFLREKVYLSYADVFLAPDQNDSTAVDTEALLAKAGLSVNDLAVNDPA